jgi:ABC-type multidrug transport system permease subunit
VLSKVCVLGAIGVLQSVLLVALCAAGGLLPTDAGLGDLATLAGVLSLTTIAGTGLGLLLSAVSSNPDFATSMVPLILLPQLMFSGVVVPISQMNVLSRGLAVLAVAKWSFELLGRATGLIDILSAQNTTLANVLRASYRSAFLPAGWGHAAVLGAFIAALLIASTAALEVRGRS